MGSPTFLTTRVKSLRDKWDWQCTVSSGGGSNTFLGLYNLPYYDASTGNPNGCIARFSGTILLLEGASNVYKGTVFEVDFGVETFFTNSSPATPTAIGGTFPTAQAPKWTDWTTTVPALTVVGGYAARPYIQFEMTNIQHTGTTYVQQFMDIYLMQSGV